MSDAKDAFGFGRFVPGFDFLQTLARQGGAGAASMPGVPNWVAPTFDIDEIDKRIEELKAVQFWLDQNATALKATLQALEVQKMTLAALRGMNMKMDDVAGAFTARPPANPYADMSRPITPPAPPRAAAEPRVEDNEEDEDDAPPEAAAPAPAAAKPKKAGAKATGKTSAKAKAAPAAPGLVDPLQWWGALTDQFQQIAGHAMKDGAPGPFANAFAQQPPATKAAPAPRAAAKKATAKKPAAKAKKTARPVSGTSTRRAR